MAEEKTQTTIACLDCETALEIPTDPDTGKLNPEIGDVLVCGECGAEMEIVKTEPVEIDYLYVMK